ncbi:hypothetical protein F511_11916 [Dorcoceras hygrometricum]|uniref:Secreted protein n=1 Tax=Dorcoceras hygrometricum TaxID=472368 RepID=A0A2Z7B2N1_9LAMI|nr:hypothetical protein F511_11916 [Dorcoceras hygrometricum]
MAACKTPSAVCFLAARCVAFTWVVLSCTTKIGAKDGQVMTGWTWGWSSRQGSGQWWPEQGERRRCRRWYQSGGSGGVLACCVELRSRTTSLTPQDGATPPPPPPPPQLTPYDRASVCEFYF